MALANDLKDKAIHEFTKALPGMAVRILAKFDPTAGALMSLYDGFTWLINNQETIQGFITSIINSMGSLAAEVS